MLHCYYRELTCCASDGAICLLLENVLLLDPLADGDDELAIFSTQICHGAG